MRHIYLVFAVMLLAANTACAASFDCAKAGTKVEKMICTDAELSKLDEKLGKVYSKALKKTSELIVLKQQQRDWLKERNKCVSKKCVKTSYESHLVKVSNNIDMQRNTLLLIEKTKGEMVSKILNGIELKLKPGPMLKPHENAEFCEMFLDDFKQQRGIEYIEPKFRTNDYNFPELALLRSQCPNIKWEWMAPKKCDAKALAYWLKGYEGDKAAAQKKST